MELDEIKRVYLLNLSNKCDFFLSDEIWFKVRRGKAWRRICLWELSKPASETREKICQSGGRVLEVATRKKGVLLVEGQTLTVKQTKFNYDKQFIF